MPGPFRRIVCLVADGFGVGEAPDAADYGDEGSNTLVNTARAVGSLKLPNLEKLGLGHLGKAPGLTAVDTPLALVGRMAERSAGKDTTTGHWEIAGLVTTKAFALFPDGFPKDLVDAFVREANLPGVLGNKAASGTTIIEELGEESIRTGKPILYTSGDSVFQIAASEETFGLEQLYRICETARKLTLAHQIGRVIARPFVGNRKGQFKRTEHRRDYSIAPGPNCLDHLTRAGVPVYSVGKIEDIFDHRGITKANHTGNNRDGLRVTLEYLKDARGKGGFVFTNLVDFDQLYGHRRDPKGYAGCLAEMDEFFPKLLSELTVDDCLVLTADHGCDPTFRGTDHTREYVPLVVYSPRFQGRVLGDRQSFADVSASVLKGFGVAAQGSAGTSFL
jgi:phosphopentomutase